MSKQCLTKRKYLGGEQYIACFSKFATSVHLGLLVGLVGSVRGYGYHPPLPGN